MLVALTLMATNLPFFASAVDGLHFGPDLVGETA